MGFMIRSFYLNRHHRIMDNVAKALPRKDLHRDPPRYNALPQAKNRAMTLPGSQSEASNPGAELSVVSR
jgi:hypothetical protein